MHPRPLLSVMAPLESMQNCAGGSPPRTRFCPSPSWPMVPDTPPEAERPKQQVLLLPTRAFAPAAKAATATTFFIIGKIDNE